MLRTRLRMQLSAVRLPLCRRIPIDDQPVSKDRLRLPHTSPVSRPLVTTTCSAAHTTAHMTAHTATHMARKCVWGSPDHSTVLPQVHLVYSCLVARYIAKSTARSTDRSTARSTDRLTAQSTIKPVVKSTDRPMFPTSSTAPTAVVMDTATTEIVVSFPLVCMCQYIQFLRLFNAVSWRRGEGRQNGNGRGGARQFA